MQIRPKRTCQRVKFHLNVTLWILIKHAGCSLWLIPFRIQSNASHKFSLQFGLSHGLVWRSVAHHDLFWFYFCFFLLSQKRIYFIFWFVLCSHIWNLKCIVRELLIFIWWFDGYYVNAVFVVRIFSDTLRQRASVWAKNQSINNIVIITIIISITIANFWIEEKK